MTNTELLTEKIKASGLRFGFIAEKMGISRQALYSKVKNISAFNQYEIKDICDILRISDLEEREAIFFADDVD